MILRLLKIFSVDVPYGELATMPLDDNPYADWSCRWLTDDRAPYILISNTRSLYSYLMRNEGIRDVDLFYDRVLRTIREHTAEDDQRWIYQRYVVPFCRSYTLAESLNSSVTRSTGAMVRKAQTYLIRYGMTPSDVSDMLNTTPRAILGDATPRDVFQTLAH